MPFPINPPQAPIGSASLPNGQVVKIQVSPEWYRFFAAMQEVVGGDPSPFDEAGFFAEVPGQGETVSLRSVEEAPLLERPRMPEAERDDFTPPVHVQAAEDNLTPPHRLFLESDNFLNPLAKPDQAITLGPNYLQLAFLNVPFLQGYSNGIVVLFGPLATAVYTVATLPTPGLTGWTAWASDCCVFDGAGTQETTGNGTGGLVSYNGSNWVIAGTNVTASA